VLSVVGERLEESPVMILQEDSSSSCYCRNRGEEGRGELELQWKEYPYTFNGVLLSTTCTLPSEGGMGQAI